MPDISEVFLQAAQVIGQNIRFQQQNQIEQERLKLEKEKQDEIAAYHDQSLQMREEAFQAKQELESLKTKVEQMRAETSRMNAETAGVNAETGRQNAETNAYKARVQAAATASKLTNEDFVKLQKELDAKVVGVKTGDPELDKGLIYLTQTQLRNTYGKVRAVVEGSAPLPPEMQQVARYLNIPDPEYANREKTKIEKLLSARDQYTKEKLIPLYQTREANVLKSMSFLEDAQQTQNLSAQNSQSAQMRQNADASSQAVLGAPPGVIGGPLTPETQAALSEVANFTSEMLGDPKGNAAAVQKLTDMIRERKLANDNNGATAIGAAAAQKNPSLARKASDLYKSLYGNQK